MLKILSEAIQFIYHSWKKATQLLYHRWKKSYYGSYRKSLEIVEQDKKIVSLLILICISRPGSIFIIYCFECSETKCFASRKINERFSDRQQFDEIEIPAKTFNALLERLEIPHILKLKNDLGSAKDGIRYDLTFGKVENFKSISISNP